MEDGKGEAKSLTLAATVRGRVQNVGFRMFVQEWATRMGLRGYVRNAPDGSVEVVACGERIFLEGLLAALHKGPIAARVDSIDHCWVEHDTPNLAGRFEVRA